ncbi:hypothetical protein JCM17380_49560 [Desulfosporosinus burensis]
MKKFEREALAMKRISELVKFLKDPHAKRVQQHKGRYQELDDLSNIAIEIGDEMAYKSLQSELREVFFDYTTAIVVDSIYKLVPHVLIIWLISLKWPTITVPFVDWKVNILGFYLLSYMIFHLGKLLAKPIMTALSKLRIFGFVRATNKI